MKRLKELIRLDFMLTNDFKANCTFLMSLIAIALFVINPTREQKICMYAMFVSTIADLVLMNYKNIPGILFKSKQFYVGMVLFAITHMLYLYCFYDIFLKANLSLIAAMNALITFIIVTVISIFLWCVLAYEKGILFKVTSLVYIFVISSALCIIYFCAYFYSGKYIYAAIGITLFLISDIMILIRETVKDTSLIRKLIWIFYPIGQLLIIFNN